LESEKESLHFKSEPLGAKHNRAAFSCGDAHLDAYLKTQATQERKKNLCAVFVLTPDEKTIAGYYTLSQYSVDIEEIPEAIWRKLTRYKQVPATLLGRLARSVDYRGKGVGEKLVVDALRRHLDISREVGSWAVIVDAKDEEAAAFYRKFGFIDFPNVPKRLFLPTATIEDMFA
jgi:predicted GNAT family N-acyltransferase